MKLKLYGEEQLFEFEGAFENWIELTLYPKKLEVAGHVVVLALYQGQLVFTKHKQRGLEWPGGKVERGETPIQAAVREVAEETGAEVASLWLVGQYRVKQQDACFTKNVYIADVHALHAEHSGTDTNGVILVPVQIQPTEKEGFSPLVTDQVFTIIREQCIDIK